MDGNLYKTMFFFCFVFFQFIAKPCIEISESNNFVWGIYQSSHDGLFWKNVLLRILTKSLKNKCGRVHYICYMTDHVFEMYLRILQLKIKKIGRGPCIHFFMKELYNFFWALQFLRVPNFKHKVFLKWF